MLKELVIKGEITMATLNEDYVSKETAKLMKDKRFDGECRAYYIHSDSDLHVAPTPLKYKILLDETLVLASTLAMAMKWLRLTHKIYIQAFTPVYDMDCAELGVTYNVIITNLANQCLAFDTPLEDIEYNSPEEAHEAAIKYCLENLI